MLIAADEYICRPPYFAHFQHGGHEPEVVIIISPFLALCRAG